MCDKMGCTGTIIDLYQISYFLAFPLTSFQKFRLSFVAASQVLLKGIGMVEPNGVVVIVFCLY